MMEITLIKVSKIKNWLYQFQRKNVQRKFSNKNLPIVYGKISPNFDPKVDPFQY